MRRQIPRPVERTGPVVPIVTSNDNSPGLASDDFRRVILIAYAGGHYGISSDKAAISRPASTAEAWRVISATKSERFAQHRKCARHCCERAPAAASWIRACRDLPNAIP